MCLGSWEPRPEQRVGWVCFWACELSDSGAANVATEKQERPTSVHTPFTSGLLSSWLKRCLYMKQEVLGLSFPCLGVLSVEDAGCGTRFDASGAISPRPPQTGGTEVAGPSVVPFPGVHPHNNYPEHLSL